MSVETAPTAKSALVKKEETPEVELNPLTEGADGPKYRMVLPYSFQMIAICVKKILHQIPGNVHLVPVDAPGRGNGTRQGADWFQFPLDSDFAENLSDRTLKHGNLS